MSSNATVFNPTAFVPLPPPKKEEFPDFEKAVSEAASKKKK
jgi:hypothetical protein